MNVVRSAWLEDAGQEADDFLELLQTQWNVNLVRYAALVKNLNASHSDLPVVKGLNESYALAKDLPPESLSWVFADPLAVYWNHAARNMSRRLENRDAIIVADAPHLDGQRDPLGMHLGDIGRFLVSAALVGCRSLSVDCAVQDGWLRLPGLGIGVRIEGAANVRVEVVAGASRRVRIGPEADFDLEEFLEPRERGYTCRDGLEALPSMTALGRTILIDPRDAYFRKGWVLTQSFPGSLMARELTDKDFPSWCGALSETFEYLQVVWPEIANEISIALRTIVPVASPAAGRSISCSAPCFAGAIMASLDSPLYLGETLIHEVSHIVLYAVMDQHGILAADCDPEPVFYSPWRSDARPLAGLLHAVYVFERVAEYYYRFLLRQPDHACRERYSAIVARLEVGLRSLQMFARLNDAGNIFVARLSTGVHKHRASGSVVSSDSITRELASHLSSWRERYPKYPSP